MTPSEELLSAYLDDELGAQDRADVERRLASDSQWRDTLEKLREVRSWMRELPTVVPSHPKSITQMLAEHQPTTPEADLRLNGSATLTSAPASWKWMMALAATGLVAIASTFWWMSGLNQQIAWFPGLEGPSLEGPASAVSSSSAPASAAPASAARTEDQTMAASATGMAVEAASEVATGDVTLGRSEPNIVENAPKPDEFFPLQAMAEPDGGQGMGGLAPSPKALPGAAEGLAGAADAPQVFNDPAQMRAGGAAERSMRNAPVDLGGGGLADGVLGSGALGSGGLGSGGLGSGNLASGSSVAGEIGPEEIGPGEIGPGEMGGMLGGTNSSSQASVPTISRFLSEKSTAAESSLYFLAMPDSNAEKSLLPEPADAASRVASDTFAKAANADDDQSNNLKSDKTISANQENAEVNGMMVEDMVYLIVPAEAFEDLEKNWKPGISERQSQNQLAQEAPLSDTNDLGLGKNEEVLKRLSAPNAVWLLEMSPENYESMRLRWSESGFDVTEILDDRKLMLARRRAVSEPKAQAGEGAQAPQPLGTANPSEGGVGAAQPDFIFILLQRR